jgi:hypothetical protein
VVAHLRKEHLEAPELTLDFVKSVVEIMKRYAQN